MKNYKELDAWQMAMKLTNEVYGITKHYPKEEIFSLTSQTKRAAVSIPANIAEGVGRQYRKDTIQFLHIARGSLYELETLLLIALNTEIIKTEMLDTINPLIEKSLQILNGLINYYINANLK